jgi:O-antigen/teichoic acid export membrane protein
VSAYPALIVLAAGASIGALAGPATHVLLLTGNEGSYPRLMGCTLLLRFGLIAILGPTYGLMGAVVAWCISAVFMTAALIIACRRLVGLDPSLLQAFGSLRQPVTPIERGTP